MSFLKSLILLCSLALLVLSCNKDDDPPQPSAATVTYPDYTQLKVGNYWIYQRFQIDNGTATPLAVFDSVYVEKDTLMRGNKYFLLKAPIVHASPGERPGVWLRDSLHYLVGRSGTILFSSEDFQTVYRKHHEVLNQDTIYSLVSKMADRDYLQITPAGVFTTSSYQSAITIYPPHAPAKTTHYQHQRYAKNVGKVMEVLPEYLTNLAQNKWVERRLVRYQVQ